MSIYDILHLLTVFCYIETKIPRLKLETTTSNITFLLSQPDNNDLDFAYLFRKYSKSLIKHTHTKKIDLGFSWAHKREVVPVHLEIENKVSPQTVIAAAQQLSKYLVMTWHDQARVSTPVWGHSLSLGWTLALLLTSCRSSSFPSFSPEENNKTKQIYFFTIIQCFYKSRR